MFSAKKILLVAFIIVLIIAIPVTIYLVSLQQKPKASSVPTTTLAFSPQTQSAKTGDNLSFDININPGSNSVSLVKILISYDDTKLSAADGSFVPNGSSFPSIVAGPTYEPGKISITMSIGANSQPINQPTKIGTVTFKALAPTDTTSTQLTFGNETQVLSTGATDQFNQNVLSGTTPADISIASSQSVLTPTPAIAEVQTTTSTPSSSLNSTSSSLLIPTPSLTQITDSASGPACLSFTADRALDGIVPFNVNFTLVATDAAATTTKATFNFGDGQVKDLTQADGISGFGANALTSHVYNTAGTFVATGSITDANGNTSSTANCSLTVVVGAPGTTAAPSPLPPTGPSNLVTFGAVGIILAIIGGVLLLAL